MKKLLLITGIVFLFVSAEAQQAGRAKISFMGFRCLRETADDILHLDGKADEVFFRFYFTIAGQNGNTKLKYSNQSDTYGDAHGIFTNRVSAGSAVDLFGGLKGGIKAGDNYYCNNIIGEYDLAAGDVLTVVPTIWEWDPGTGYQNAFDATIDGAYTTVNQRASNISNSQLVAGFRPAEMAGLFIIDAGHMLALKAVFNIIGELTPKPRPVGITTNGDYSPKAVLLNGNVMQGIANSNFGYGPGVIPVQYNEEALGNSRDHGNYIILLKVEFTPSANSGYNNAPPPPPPPRSNTNTAPPPPPPAATNTNTAPPPPPANTSGNMRKIAKPVTVTIDGVWSGTWGNGDSNSPNQYSFRLNADGTMQVIGANGAVTASGNYTFANNQLLGSYTYTSGGLFSFSATMDADGTLNGTWGSGANVRGGGRWIMTKAARQSTGNIR